LKPPGIVVVVGIELRVDAVLSPHGESGATGASRASISIKLMGMRGRARTRRPVLKIVRCQAARQNCQVF
jgi:hypothetical protein